MSRVIGVVCEGPADYETIKCVIDNTTQTENEFLLLQPEESLTGHLGNGWKGVWKWCEQHRSILYSYMRMATPQIDCLIIHMDGDVAYNEKEVHCACATERCEHVGTIHPLECAICRKGNCPVVLPCEKHEAVGYAKHLNDMISSWLLITAESVSNIITIPCHSTDTWVAVSYGDLTDTCETHIDPWDSIIARSPYYHGIRIQGGKKHTAAYRELAHNVSSEWDTVKRYCAQARLFDENIRKRLCCN